MSDAHGDKVHEVYHTGLRNLHAVEMTAMELTERQAERLQHYPEIEARLRQHRAESEQQAQRLAAIMERHGIAPSSVKNAFTTVMGNVAAMLHVPAPDEIVKNTFANYAFEHYEIAAYTGLIAMAERVGDVAAVAPLRQSLAEEQAMAQFCGDHIGTTIARFLDLTAMGETAKA